MPGDCVLPVVVVFAVPSDFEPGEAVCIPVGSSAVDSAGSCVVTGVGLFLFQVVYTSNVSVPLINHVDAGVDVSGGISERAVVVQVSSLESVLVMVVDTVSQEAMTPAPPQGLEGNNRQRTDKKCELGARGKGAIASSNKALAQESKVQKRRVQFLRQ